MRNGFNVDIKRFWYDGKAIGEVIGIRLLVVFRLLKPKRLLTEVDESGKEDKEGVKNNNSSSNNSNSNNSRQRFELLAESGTEEVVTNNNSNKKPQQENNSNKSKNNNNKRPELLDKSGKEDEKGVLGKSLAHAHTATKAKRNKLLSLDQTYTTVTLLQEPCEGSVTSKR